MFNLFLTQSVIPTCFKQTTIVPVLKNGNITCLNDYRPFVLTSVAMKCFERLVMSHINNIIPDTLNPIQFLGVHITKELSFVFIKDPQLPFLGSGNIKVVIYNFKYFS